MEEILGIPGFLTCCWVLTGRLPRQRRRGGARSAGGTALGVVGAQAARRIGRSGTSHRRRFSLCCAKDGCRKRETPGSLRFLGRKVYFGAMVVLISAMQSGLNPARMARLKALVGVSRRTVLRCATGGTPCS